ncbi:uncharacterized protein VTP21DRAFT_6838 [Calcarisporiella thermophila]|uniref:uncharacterized protein n=1 Tax=Calcarisporiella thermophila TaxID=911321 RepID=UPI0037438DE4
MNFLVGLIWNLDMTTKVPVNLSAFALQIPCDCARSSAHQGIGSTSYVYSIHKLNTTGFCHRVSGKPWSN